MDLKRNRGVSSSPQIKAFTRLVSMTYFIGKQHIVKIHQYNSSAMLKHPENQLLLVAG